MVEWPGMKLSKFIILPLYFLIFSAVGISVLHAENNNNKAGQKTVRLGFFNDDTNFMSYRPNQKSGYGYEYLQAVANMAGWKYEYVYGSFSKLYSELEQGKIDILSNVTKDDERAKKMLFPDEPMGTEATAVYVRNDDKRFTGFYPGLLNGKKIAADESDLNFRKFADFIAENRISCEIIDYSKTQSLSLAYNNPEIDAVLDSDLFAESGWDLVLKINSSEFYVAVANGRKDILDELNKAQKQIQISNPFYNGKLHEKYYLSKKISQNTDKTENDWLEKHYFQIKVGCLKDDSPFIFYNKKSQKAEGALVEFLKATVSKMNLSGSSLSFVFYDSMEEMENALEKQEVDIIYPVLSDYYLAEDKDYMISERIFRIPLSIIYNDKFPEKNVRRIAVWNCEPVKNYLKQYYPKITPVYLKSKKEAIDAVSSKKYDGVLLDSFSAENAINTNKKFKNYKMNLTDNPLDVSLAVKRDSIGLLSILSKGLVLCNENACQNMILFQDGQAQTLSARESARNSTFFYCCILFLAAALLFIIIYEFLMLRRYSGCASIALIISKKKLSALILEEIRKSRDLEGSPLPLCLFIARIANYKSIRNIYGKKCASEAIFQLAKAATIDRNCIVFRSAKNEVAVLSHKNAEEIKDEAKTSRNEIQQNGIIFKNKKVKIKIDFGIAEYKPGIMPLQLYAIADRNLFDSKIDIKPEPRF